MKEEGSADGLSRASSLTVTASVPCIWANIIGGFPVLSTTSVMFLPMVYCSLSLYMSSSSSIGASKTAVRRAPVLVLGVHLVDSSLGRDHLDERARSLPQLRLTEHEQRQIVHCPV